MSGFFGDIGFDFGGGFDFDFNFGEGGDNGGQDGAAVTFHGDKFAAEDCFKVFPSKVASHYVKTENARKLARQLDITAPGGFHCEVITGGRFVFGELIGELFEYHRIRAKRLTISTLSFDAGNVEMLRTLLESGQVENLRVLSSVYFFGHEQHGLIPYLVKRCGHCEAVESGRATFGAAIGAIHTKTAALESAGGHFLTMTGSANLRSSQNIEQTTITTDPGIYRFYEDYFDAFFRSKKSRELDLGTENGEPLRDSIQYTTRAETYRISTNSEELGG